MELRDYLKALKPRLWLVVLVPVLAVVASLVFSGAGAGSYRTTGTVSTPPIDGASAAVQYALDFQAVVASGAALGRVSDETGVSRADLTDRLTTERVSDSSVMRVVYQTPDRDPDLSKRVVESFSRAVVDLVYRSNTSQAEAELFAAEQQLFAAQQSLTARQQERDKFLADGGYARPDDAMREAVAGLATLQTRLDVARVEGESESELTAAVDKAKARLNELGPRAVQFAGLESAFGEARTAVDDATDRRANAQIALERARPRTEVTITSDATTVEGQSLRRAVAAGVLGLVLGILLAVALEARRPRSTPTSGTGPTRTAETAREPELQPEFLGRR